MTKEVGFSLIEILVSLFIFSSLILALFLAQANSLKLYREIEHYAAANRLMQDLLERINHNSSALMTYQQIDSEAIEQDCVSQLCTAEQLALFDISQWQTLKQRENLPDFSVCLEHQSLFLQLGFVWREVGQENLSCDSEDIPFVQHYHLIR